MAVTGTIIIHNDASMLGHALSSAQPYVDRLVVVDGAYEWAAPFCELNGERPDRSTDNLIEVLDKSGIPYEYISGTWRSETEKRTASIEAAGTDRIMRIDADEIYQVDEEELERFWLSDSSLGAMSAPLFLSPGTILSNARGVHDSRAPIFFNLKNASISDILNGLWLVRPKNERERPNSVAKIYNKSLGVFFHLSPMRSAENSYRRARFYCLVSMRIAQTVGFGVNRKFATDRELLDILLSLDHGAVDCAFRLHRIASSFPELKAGQALMEYTVSDPQYISAIQDIYEEMMFSQRVKCYSFLDSPRKYFSGRQNFLDVTAAVQDGAAGFRIAPHYDSTCSIKLHLDFGVYREEIDGVYEVLLPSFRGSSTTPRRVLIEYVVRSPVGYVEDIKIRALSI